MREGSIILPAAEMHPYGSQAHAHLRNRLVDCFGGYTETQGRGGWKAPSGETVVEPVTIYTVAGSNGSFGWPSAYLLAAAKTAASMMDQEAVYIRDFAGEVMIIPLKGEAPNA